MFMWTFPSVILSTATPVRTAFNNNNNAWSLPFTVCTKPEVSYTLLMHYGNMAVWGPRDAHHFREAAWSNDSFKSLQTQVEGPGNTNTLVLSPLTQKQIHLKSVRLSSNKCMQGRAIRIPRPCFVGICNYPDWLPTAIHHWIAILICG